MRPVQPARHLLTQEASGECCCLRGASTQLDRPSPRRGPTERCMEGCLTQGLVALAGLHTLGFGAGSPL